MQVDWLPSELPRGRIFGLDAFRGLAASLVFLFHFWTFYLLDQRVDLFGLDFTMPFAAGHLGVDIFFVLSGLLIFLSLVQSSSLRTYFRRRVLRIVPLALFFTLTLFVVKMDFSRSGWTDFLAHFFFLQGFFQTTYHGLNPVMWTLSVEMLFYLLLPILLWLGRKKLWHFFGILSVLVVLNFWYRWYLVRFFPEWDSFERIFASEQLWGRFDQFALGIGLGVLWIFRAKIQNMLQKVSPILMLIGLLGFFATIKIFAEFGSSFREIAWMQVFLHFLVGLSFALFLVAFLFASQKWQRIFTPSFLGGLGIISYSIYLWHFPILIVFAQRFPDPWIGGLFAFVTTICCSAISYWLIERPFLRKKEAKLISSFPS